MATVSSFTATPDVQLQLLEVTDGKFHRRVIKPGDDLSNETAEIRTGAEQIHTPVVVTTFIYEGLKAQAERYSESTVSFRAAADADPSDEKAEAKAVKMEAADTATTSQLAAAKAAMDAAKAAEGT